MDSRGSYSMRSREQIQMSLFNLWKLLYMLFWNENMALVYVAWFHCELARVIALFPATSG
jgi:hypothetical protein